MQSFGTSSPENLWPRWLRLGEASRYSGLSVSGLRNLVSAGSFSAARPNRVFLLDREDLDDFLQRSKS